MSIWDKVIPQRKYRIESMVMGGKRFYAVRSWRFALIPWRKRYVHYPSRSFHRPDTPFLSDEPWEYDASATMDKNKAIERAVAYHRFLREKNYQVEKPLDVKKEYMIKRLEQ